MQLTPDKLEGEVVINGYITSRQESLRRKAGGVALSQHHSSILPEIPFTGSLWFEISVFLSKILLLGIIYGPPQINLAIVEQLGGIRGSRHFYHLHYLENFNVPSAD